MIDASHRPFSRPHPAIWVRAALPLRSGNQRRLDSYHARGADMIVKLTEGPLDTHFGTFSEHLYYDGISETIALVMGEVADGQSVPCRIHSACIAAHAFNSV